MADLTSRWSALLASGRAEWRAGMLVRGSITMRLDWRDPDGRWNGAYTHGDGPRGGWLRVIEASMTGEWAPDWSDGPTRGALLDQVRERWGDPYLIAVWSPERKLWGVGSPLTIGQPGRVSCTGETEAEALLAALEAAPEGA